MDDAQLQRLLDGAMAAEGAAGRRRRRLLAQIMADDAGLAGLLVDLCETGADVVMRTITGRLHRGRLRLVGVDFVMLDGPVEAWVRLAAITSVTPTRPPSGPGSDRTGADVLFVEALARLAEDRPRVTVVSPGDVIGGVLIEVGVDVLTVQPAEAGARVYVSAVTATEVLRSG